MINNYLITQPLPYPRSNIYIQLQNKRTYFPTIGRLSLTKPTLK